MESYKDSHREAKPPDVLWQRSHVSLFLPRTLRLQKKFQTKLIKLETNQLQVQTEYPIWFVRTVWFCKAPFVGSSKLCGNLFFSDVQAATCTFGENQPSLLGLAKRLVSLGALSTLKNRSPQKDAKKH